AFLCRWLIEIDTVGSKDPLIITLLFVRVLLRLAVWPVNLAIAFVSLNTAAEWSAQLATPWPVSISLIFVFVIIVCTCWAVRKFKKWTDGFITRRVQEREGRDLALRIAMRKGKLCSGSSASLLSVSAIAIGYSGRGGGSSG